MLEGINYLHSWLQINILKNKKVIKLLELWQKKGKNREINRAFTNTKNKIFLEDPVQIRQKNV